MPTSTRDRAALRRLGGLLPVVGAATLFALLDTEGSLRTILLRYAFAAVGAFAVAPPHLLLPDRTVGLLHLVNPRPRDLFARQMLPWSLAVAAFLVPPLVLAFGRGDRLPLMDVALVILSVGAYAFAHYTAIGAASQAWQEGRAGGWYHRIREVAPQIWLNVPLGLVPSVLASARVFVVGAGVTLATAALANAGLPGLGWLPPAILLAVSGTRLARRVLDWDRAFYQTNALYAEVLASGDSRATERAPVPVESVYWAPASLRPHVWAGLVQLDRRLPLGRLFALGVLVVWVMMIRGTSAEIVAATLGLGLVAKNSAVFLLTAPRLAPRAFDLTLQRESGWTATRFLVNVRWTLPLALALALAAYFSDTFSYGEAVLWVVLDLTLALFTSWLATYAAEGRYRRRFA